MNMSAIRAAIAASCLLVGLPVLIAACADDTTTLPGGDSEQCLQLSCERDADCGDCEDGRTACKESPDGLGKFCSACTENTATGCLSGQFCSPKAKCEKYCPGDNQSGSPDKCKVNADCKNCTGKNVCDATTGQCEECTSLNAGACKITEACNEDNECGIKCPTSCKTDIDCETCDAPGYVAHACNAGKCAECSPTYPCPLGQECSAQGTCLKRCGIPGDFLKGTCEDNTDCAGCAGGNTECHIPINGGRGQCGPAAPGCNALGQQLTLPEPYDQYTELCEDDAGCDSVSIDYNIGKLLRETLGINELNDATISYGMHECAEVTLASETCGVCVPCEQDSDCEPIDITNDLLVQLIGPLGAVATKVALQLIFDESDYKAYMYCEPVGGGYGICAPCPGLTSDCRVNCAHDAFTQGAPLNAGCGLCEQKVCAAAPICCNQASGQWNAACVDKANQLCVAGCEHGVCVEGVALDATCGSCITAVCAADPYCCNNAWDATCVLAVAANCGAPENCTNVVSPAQCDAATDCTGGKGCLWDRSCGTCTADIDCYPAKCNSGTCG